ncbi:hypothetical protein TWF696_002462 [Orbilia brochopaga]|uniref:Uncharacterized protein n=1 Tax=Orbilia brochopaga TaxID=3140254 RepID=A0AAV9U898_9PEZI
MIGYMGFNIPKPVTSPKFYRALVDISEVLRMLIRPESIGDYKEYDSALEALVCWEKSHQAEISTLNSPDHPEGSLDPPAYVGILYSVVISLFILQDPLFAMKHSQQENQAQALETNGDMPSTHSGILEILLRALNIHIAHPVLFARWGYLGRFSEIIALAIIRLTSGFILPEDVVLEEQSHVVVNWKMRCMITEERWLKILALVGQNRGWEVVLDLSDEFVDEDEELE